MYGTIFMVNPLACVTANANLTLLKKSNFNKKIKNISHYMFKKLIF